MTRISLRLLVLSLFAAGVALLPARTAMAASTRVAADLIPERASIQPGSTLWVALRLRPPEGWHTYWSNPGDSGLATTIAWTLPIGLSAGPISWPRPERLLLGPLAIYAYEDVAVLLIPIKIPAQFSQNQQVTLSADASWVVCKDVCIPEQTTLKLVLPVAEHPAPVDPSVAALFSNARAKLPQLSPWPMDCAS
jgi:thiol:disulfide interchange protein DsbD